MSREADFATRMTGDTALMAILTGGVYQSGVVGEDGITRGATPAAFDTNGWLEPCCLLKQRGRVPTSEVVDYLAQVVSTNQVVEVWLYEDSGYTNIDAAVNRLYALFQGYSFSDTFEVALANLIDRERDQGALKGRSLARMDFAVYSVMIPT